MSGLENAARTVEAKGRELLEGADPAKTTASLLQAVHDGQGASLSGTERLVMRLSKKLTTCDVMNGYFQRDEAHSHDDSPTLHIHCPDKGLEGKSPTLEIKPGPKETNAKYAGASINLETGEVTFVPKGK
jgi:hypothetical protein